MKFELDLAPSVEGINEIRNGLVEYNTPFLSGIESSEVALYVSRENQKLGGIIADITGSWLTIKFLWVDKSVRSRGVGRDLVLKMEAHAVSVGCHSALLNTYSFQAKPFYEKLGYECLLTLENIYKSHNKHYLVKRLSCG